NANSLSRSTLSDALQKRSPEPLKAVCQLLLTQVGRQQRRSIAALLSLIDSTRITLRGPRCDDWALATKTRITQGPKIHVGLEAQQLAQTDVNVTPANLNDLSDALQMPIEAGVTYVFDKGYCDYNWWHRIDQAGSVFVTRLKKNANVARIRELTKTGTNPVSSRTRWFASTRKSSTPNAPTAISDRMCAVFGSTAMATSPT